MSWCGGGEISADARSRMAQFGDEFGHLEAGQLPAFTGLGTLSHLDFDLFGRHPDTQPSPRTVPLAICLIPRNWHCRHWRVGRNSVHLSSPPSPETALAHRCGSWRWPAFRALRGLSAPSAHARRYETLANLGDRLDFIDRPRRLSGREVEFQQVAQIDGRQVLRPRAKIAGRSNNCPTPRLFAASASAGAE